MLKTGDLVFERNYDLNNKKQKERMFVVLFNFWYENEEYVCCCQITNTVKTKNNEISYSKKYLYIPYEILSNKKLCSIKLTTARMYKSNEVYKTGLNLKPEIMLRVFESIINMDLDKPYIDKEHFEYIKNNIAFIREELKEQEEKIKKEEKKSKKIRRKELKRNYDNIKKK